MSNGMFVLGLGAVLAAVYALAFRVLPRERWQVAWVFPVSRMADGSWEGVNFTMYGILTGASVALATALALVLMAAAGVPLVWGGILALTVLAVCVPAAGFLAGIVEGKRHTFSVGAAVFAGVLVTPVLAWVVSKAAGDISMAGPMIAATGLAYALGEGTGRLACLSFGCCYGRRIDSLPRPWQRLFGAVAMIFEGRTKKIAYAHGLDGVPVVPIQAMTAVVCTLIALAGTWFFLSGRMGLAVAIAIGGTQLWRFGSEFLRADFRGRDGITAYQYMSLGGAAVGIGLASFMAPTGGHPDLARGLGVLWRPEVLLGLQAVWLGTAWRMGRSRVTGARVELFVRNDLI
ncbi:MAG: prolipoprotein diacylglyceryl transferase [Deltaproteobacteria bacterium]|nr:prolipoprotein diacylglyceryl transferase [Deltaproteobacteria bacterium]